MSIRIRRQKLETALEKLGMGVASPECGDVSECFFPQNSSFFVYYVHLGVSAMRRYVLTLEMGNFSKKQPQLFNNIQQISSVSLKEIISNRTIHSKFLIFSGHHAFILVVSPNFTEPALNRTIDNGNVEVAIVGKLENQKLFDDLRLENNKRMKDL
ncbi:hypothetical protein KEJ47_06955 [Candidatus Bathyarchaeota archaeon]|nr:hypothetical protein [Candidatus Bathyarchaeota archaeon]